MQNEIFDVVNESDEVIGRELRPEVHRKGLRHRAVHVIVKNSAGKIFLQKRSIHKDTFPGAWDSSASGHLDCGENYDACALRELREELGFTPVAPPRRLFKINACADTGHEFVWVYLCGGEGPFTLHPQEIETGGWFTPKEISEWMKRSPNDFASALVHLWPKLQPYLTDP